MLKGSRGLRTSSRHVLRFVFAVLVAASSLHTCTFLFVQENTLDAGEEKFELQVKGRPLAEQPDVSIATMPSTGETKRHREGQSSPTHTSSLQEQNRSIVLVHVGKAGGMTVRQLLARDCQKKQLAPEKQAWTKKKCIDKHNSGQKLSLQVRSVFHMADKGEKSFEDATTFVVTLRNPVDRIISSYRFSHPANCIQSNDPKIRIPPSRGCVTIQSGLLEKSNQIGYKLYKQCFPSAGMEDFAQSMMIPWNNKADKLPFQNLNDSEQAECRQMARRLVQGQKMQRITPHMQYNYMHYAEEIQKYPDKEIFAIRTDHAWDDLVQIDQWMGGSGKFERHGKQYSHGSEYYEPSPVSTEAYHKLCCVLENEINVYFEIFDKALNLDDAAKAEADNQLRDQCGVTTSWEEWRATCQDRIAASELAENMLRPRSELAKERTKIIKKHK